MNGITAKYIYRLFSKNINIMTTNHNIKRFVKTVIIFGMNS